MYKDIKLSISFKTIYRYIWEIKSCGGKLLQHQGKCYKYENPNRCSIKDRIDISSRPSIVEEKKRIGDIEGDTVTALAVENAMNDSYDNSFIPFLMVT